MLKCFHQYKFTLESGDGDLDRYYIAIDLKSFFASVECVERGLDPLTTNLVVADESRTEKTICLAVSPSLKAYGIPGRARLFEVIQKCKEASAGRREEITYIIATPRMQLYVDYSTRIYKVYLKYVSEEDIHVYSIDEVFIDITNYLNLYHDEEGNLLSVRDLAVKIVQDVYTTTGITATAGIGTNMYLAKIAMDIVAKHAKADKNGVRVAFLDELSYRQQLWEHRPLTDFWRIGRGIRKRLEANGMYTMGDIARMSVSKVGYGSGEDLLYKLFGIDAEILIDHAWGVEPCTMEYIKNYRPDTKSISSGQVLTCRYEWDKARIIVREMTELHVLELVSKGYVTDSISLAIGYDKEVGDSNYDGEMVLDAYGRIVPKPVHGTIRLSRHTSSTDKIMKAVLQIFDDIVDERLGVRRVTIAFGNLLDNQDESVTQFQQMNLFMDYGDVEEEKQDEEREKKMQEAVLKIQNRFGKNAILKGTNLCEGATTIERNNQIGGHRA